MPPLRTLAVDDEPLSCAGGCLVQQHSDLEPVATCSDGASAIACLEATVDLAVLDVEMGCTGIEVVRTPARPRAVVFATAHPEFVEAFEVQAIDYLLKPYDAARFAAAVERAQRLEGAGEGARLVLRKEGRMEVVYPRPAAESADQYVHLHTAEGSRLMRESMARMEEALAPHGFLRVHRSAIVPCPGSAALAPLGRAEPVLEGGERVPVSRSRAAEVRRPRVERTRPPAPNMGGPCLLGGPTGCEGAPGRSFTCPARPSAGSLPTHGRTSSRTPSQAPPTRP